MIITIVVVAVVVVVVVVVVVIIFSRLQQPRTGRLGQVLGLACLF